jgi:hypothetical protein
MSIRSIYKGVCQFLLLLLLLVFFVVSFLFLVVAQIDELVFIVKNMLASLSSYFVCKLISRNL